MEDKDKDRVRVGSVVQITEAEKEKQGWVGAFVYVTDVKRWGVQGFVHVMETHLVSRQAFTRLNWFQIAYVGEAGLIALEGEGI